MLDVLFDVSDEQIGMELVLLGAGFLTTLVMIFFLVKLYLSNRGDSG